MKGNSILAVGVCVACFLIGCLAYVSIANILAFVSANISSCEYVIQGCSPPERSSELR
ncbi:MAG: hypothetical protein IT173_08315 [Acidobacteria bacterium]|nr:hypothetical protein [Acidobacteriota bacterium]